MPRNRKAQTFVGRENELERLGRFLSDKAGGAVLVAGDRGSGKTSLVMEAIRQRNDKLKSWRRFTLSRSVVVHIPLIIGSGIEQDKPSYYRALLMRTILRALENDLRKRKYSWLDLPERWFRSVGYVQSVHELKPYAKFLSLNQKAITNLAVSLPTSAGGSKGGIERAISGEVDISDAALEIKLRELLVSYSRVHPMIVVLDELDKLPYDSNPIELERIALLLKNLFSETNIHVLFVSDEPPMGRILRTIASDPFCPEKTLFKDMILLNQFSPQDYDNFFDKEVGKHMIDPQRAAVKFALAHHTGMMPSELRKYMLQNGSTNLEESLRASMSDYGFLYRGPMQMFISATYMKFAGKFDAYFDRVLYKSLTIAGDILLERKVDYITWKDFRTLFWTTDIFTDQTDEQTSKRVHAQKANPDFADVKAGIAVPDTPEIIVQIDAFTPDQVRQLNRALEYMVALLDRGEWIKIEMAEAMPELLRLTQFYGDTFTVANVKQPLSDVLKPTAHEREVFSKVQEYSPAYHAMFSDKQLYLEVVPSPISVDGNGWHMSDFPLSILRCYWDKQEEFMVAAPREIANALSAKLTPSLGTGVTADIKDNGVFILTYKDNHYQFVLNLGHSPTFDLSDKEKTFVLNDPRASRVTQGRNARVKNIEMHDDWGNLPVVVEELQNWLKERA